MGTCDGAGIRETRRAVKKCLRREAGSVVGERDGTGWRAAAGCRPQR